MTGINFLLGFLRIFSHPTNKYFSQQGAKKFPHGGRLLVKGVLGERFPLKKNETSYKMKK
ncbi:MAG: hypothetical protein DRG82_01865 [Deltaproteobacteria bacterium]|nr:MAG: hypothetical protein DRG82_01865 [Deltaproteobacteria bacterium]